MKAILLTIVAAAMLIAPAEARQPRPMSDHQRIIVLQNLVYQLRTQAKAAADAPAFLKHAWPALTGEEKDILAEVVRSTVPKGTKFDIICNDASCSELASDIDDAMEKAKVESVIDRSLGPLGYGVAVQVNAIDKDKAGAAVAALKKATEGRLDVPVRIAPAGANMPGYVTILIGKRPRG